MTTSRQNLLNDAATAGYTVTTDTDGTVKIIKRVGRWKKVEGLVIYSDGTAFNAAVDLGVSQGLRSYAAMRRVLGI